MQKLNRFVTYIYSYRDSQRDTNVGFAKVDCRGGIVRLEIQIRKKIKETKEAQICLLAGTPTQPEAIPIGVMKFEKETGIYKGRFSASELGGSTYTFEQVTGLYIKGERELFASQWTQEEIRIAGVRVLAVEEKPEEGMLQENPSQERRISEEQMQGEPSKGQIFRKSINSNEKCRKNINRSNRQQKHNRRHYRQSHCRDEKDREDKGENSRKARHCGRQRPNRSMTGVMNGKTG